MNIVPLTCEDESEAIDVLVSAFHDDPVMNWMSTRPGFLPQLFKMTLPMFLPKGLSFKVEGGKGVAAYLENSKEQNLAFYQGHGFKVTRQISFSKHSPKLWLMWREPQMRGTIK